MFHKNTVYEYQKKRNHPCEKHIKSIRCSLYRLNFQYYLQVIKEHKYRESKYPQLILCMLYKASCFLRNVSEPATHFTGPQSSSQMVMSLKHCCLGSDLNYLFNPLFRHTLWHPRGGTEIVVAVVVSYLFTKLSVCRDYVSQGALHYFQQSSAQKINLDGLI